MSHKTAATVAHTIGIDTGKNTPAFDRRRRQGAIVLREKIARGRIAALRNSRVPSQGRCRRAGKLPGLGRGRVGRDGRDAGSSIRWKSDLAKAAPVLCGHSFANPPARIDGA